MLSCSDESRSASQRDIDHARYLSLRHGMLPARLRAARSRSEVLVARYSHVRTHRGFRQLSLPPHGRQLITSHSHWPGVNHHCGISRRPARKQLGSRSANPAQSLNPRKLCWVRLYPIVIPRTRYNIIPYRSPDGSIAWGKFSKDSTGKIHSNQQICAA